MQTSHNFSLHLKKLATVCFLTIVLTALAPETGAEVLPIRTYTSADGLGSSAISSLMRDSRGFLWFCTRDGLTRFDGQRFTTYQVGAKDAAPGIERIYEARNGIYWITTTGGLYRFDPKADFSPSLPENILNAEYIGNSRGVIREGNDGRFWYLGSGLFLMTEKEGKLELQEVELGLPAKPQVSLGVREMIEAGDGSRWVLTTLGLVRILPDGNKIIYKLASPTTDAIFSMIMDGEGRIWISRASGIYVLRTESISELAQRTGAQERDIDKATLVRPEKLTTLPASPGEVVKLVDLPGVNTTRPKTLYRSADDHIWISTNESLIEFDGLSFHAYTAPQGLSSGAGQMVEDLNGNLWIGGTEGVARLNRRGLTTYREGDGLNTLSILVIHETSQGNLFAVSNDFFVSQFDGKKFHTVRPSSLENSYALWSSNPVFLDSHNEWWFLTHAKLLRFAAGDLRSLAQARPIAEYDMRNGLKGNEMFHMFEDSRGDLWLATRSVEADDFGLSKWTRATDTFYTFSDRENFPSRKSVSAFAEDAKGRLWIGFYEGGLVRYADGRFTEITASEPFLPEELISDLHIDRNGKLWISSSKAGVARIDDLNSERPILVRYTVANGLSSNNVRSLAEDNYGQIYAGTARGVDRITPETGRIRHYSTVDGLAADFVQSAFRDRNGVMWFGTPNGISKLVPTADVTSNPPQVWFSSLRIAGENRTVAKLGSAEFDAEELAPGQNNLQITFFGIDFTGEPLRYQYMLEGADTDWSAPTSEHTVNFSNLSAGNYRFLVRAVSGNGLVSQNPAVFSFKLLPPIWARWWFIGAAASLILLVVFSVYRYRLAQLRKVNLALDQLQKAKEERLLELERVRSRIARDLHDDIGSSLAQIAIYSEVAKQKQQGNNGADPTLQSLVNTSKELVDAMSDIVWAINPRKDHLHDLTQRMRHFASEVLSAAAMDLEFQAPESPPDFALGANIRREVFLIFKENINNITRHSGATRVEIDFLLNRDHLTLRFRDNGRGFDNSDQGQSYDWQKARGGNGLISIKKRSHELGGEYSIESQLGVGTTATLIVPLDRDLSNGAAVATQTGSDRSRLME